MQQNAHETEPVQPRLPSETDAGGLVEIVPTTDDHHNTLIAVLVKRTYSIRSTKVLERTAEKTPFIRADEYYSAEIKDEHDSEASSVLHESELIPLKPKTDIVLIGDCYAPGGRPVRQMDVKIQVGSAGKVIRVLGDRHAYYTSRRQLSFTEPKVFTRLPVRYENAYGGIDTRSKPGSSFSYPRNHVGTGYVVHDNPSAINGMKLPNLEDAADLLTPQRLVCQKPELWHRQPLPQGFGWFDKQWYPRCCHAGTVPAGLPLEAATKEETIGYVPKNPANTRNYYAMPLISTLFNNGASPGLAIQNLRSGEMIKLFNLTADGYKEFEVPALPAIMIDTGHGTNQIQSVTLNSLCISTGPMQVECIWCGVHPITCFSALSQMKKISVEVE
ncbi:MAG: DUF2169 domain-containing protein [Chitinivibrionales bacterium]|nr:DUF2169 domain-containing protein [Chitinivibrionales bacterium]